MFTIQKIHYGDILSNRDDLNNCSLLDLKTSIHIVLLFVPIPAYGTCMDKTIQKVFFLGGGAKKALREGNVGPEKPVNGPVFNQHNTVNT
jgi:hypothetical protein